MLYNLQIVRIFAIYLVVLFHFRDLTIIAGLPPLRYGGVDILLIFTGFLAVRMTAHKAVSPARFLTERLVRVAPLYWLITLVVFALALIAPSYFQATRADVAELTQSLLFIPFVKANGFVQPLVYVGWTLNYQIVFYALFAIGLLAQPKTLGVAFVGFVLVGLAATGAMLHPHGVDERFYTSPIILDLVFGMAVALVFNRLPSVAPNRVRAALSAIGAAAALGFYLWGGLGGEEAQRVLAKGVPGALFLVGVLELERFGVSLKSRFADYWAKATYSIFLTHIFVTSIAMHVVRHLALEGAPAFGVLVMGMVAVTAVGCLTYEYVEKPLTNLTRRIAFGDAARPSLDQFGQRLRMRKARAASVG